MAGDYVATADTHTLGCFLGRSLGAVKRACAGLLEQEWRMDDCFRGCACTLATAAMIFLLVVL